MVDNPSDSNDSTLPREQSLPGKSEELSNSEQDQISMRSLAEGNDLALNEIIDRWQKPISSFLYKTVGDYEIASDLAQEVFVRLYKNRHRYKSGNSFSAYIFTIAANLAKNHFRWKKRHPESSFENDQLQLEATDYTPYQKIERDERSAKVRTAVLNLPDKLRIPVILFYFEEMSYVEMAEVMNTSTKTIETRLYRARKLLQKELSIDF